MILHVFLTDVFRFKPYLILLYVTLDIIFCETFLGNCFMFVVLFLGYAGAEPQSFGGWFCVE